jgi:hypothetical protein
MRHLLGLVWCVVWCVTLAAGNLAQLRQLEDTDRIFELRRAIEQPGWDATQTLFYRAVIAARFGHETAAIDDFRKFLAGRDADREMERKANEELASALVRIGRYREAARAWTEALDLTPDSDDDRAENENTRALYEALGDVAPQTVAFGDDAPMQAARNRLGSWDVPVEVNGRRGQWIFDTGANWSTLTESEAVKMGLSIRNTQTYVRGSTGSKNMLRLAVAGDLQFGAAHLKNVVFLVLADKALFIGPLRYQITGILGLPVIRALERVGITAKGVVRIEAKKPIAQGEPNVFFHEWTPIVEIRHRDRRMQMFFDTGANASFIYLSFFQKRIGKRRDRQPEEKARKDGWRGWNDQAQDGIYSETSAGGFGTSCRVDPGQSPPKPAWGRLALPRRRARDGQRS